MFRLDSLIQAERQRLSARTGPVVKTIEIDGQREVRQLEHIDWASELQIFAKADLNKPAWQGKYAVDSVFAETGALLALHYTALDDKLKIRTIDLYFTTGKLDSLVVYEESQSMVSHASLRMKYVPAQGYEIENRQKTLLSKERILRISVTFPQ